MSGSSNGSVARCRKLASCRRRGGADTTRVHKLGANAKPRHSVVGVGALVNQSSIVMSVWHREEW